MGDASATDVIRRHIEIAEGAGGPKARIAGHRIRVQDIVILHEKMRMSVDEILEWYPDITPADVYAALAYYWDNREAIERRIADDEAYVEELRRTHVGPLQEKLMRLQRG